MKKEIHLFLAALFFFNIAISQITKKNWMIGGSGLISTQSQKITGSTIKGSDINLSPNLGYFILDKLAIGARLGYKYNRTEFNNIVTKNTRYSFGPFFRYYYLKPEKVVNLFTEGAYQYSKVSATNTLGGADNTFRLSAGPAIFFNSSVGLEVTLNYEYYINSVSEQNSKRIFLGIGFQIHVESSKNE